jgi:glutamate synthase (ferredoxin)
MLPNKQGLYSPEFEHDNCGAGFICSLKGEKTNDIIFKALNILTCLEHRGAVSSDGKTGDGAGILIEIPDDFFRNECFFELPDPQEYAVGMVFLPQKINQANYCIEIFEKEIYKQGLSVLGWREVPINSKIAGNIAAQTQPLIKQVFIGKNDNEYTDSEFITKLFVSRKIAENTIYNSTLSQKQYFYFSSLHNRTLIYKGLLIPEDIDRFYLDLSNPKFVTKLALVHQRFSTNTFPTWDLAQPFRYMCHNGEINTRRGNVSRMIAREELMKSDFIGKDLKKVFPIILDGKSDSAQMDMVVELLLTTGRSLPEVMMMMVPEAWEKHKSMSDEKRAFYEFNSCIMEPWDGPASVPFTDGKYIGALLDRNGLRPSRYTVTKDGYVVMSSETGVVDIAPSNVEKHGRLEPGKMFLVDMNEGRIIEDEEIKNKIVSKHPYRKWLNQNILPLKNVPYTGNKTPLEKLDLETRLRIFGYTEEDLKTIILPMCVSGKEAIGSMGTDTPLAVLSEKPQLLFNYFKQLFAQVTNPPLDGIREEIVTDTSLGLGSDFNLYDIVSDHSKKLKINNPIISNEDLDKIKFIKNNNFKSATISALYNLQRGHNGIEEALDKMVIEVSKKVDEGCNIIIISDRGVTKELGSVPILLACSNIHHCLMKLKKRSKFGIVIESSEPREPHHFSMLFGFGASAINPYLVNEVIKFHSREKLFWKTKLENFY